METGFFFFFFLNASNPQSNIHMSFHSFIKYLLKTYYLLGSVLVDWAQQGNKRALQTWNLILERKHNEQ